MKFICAIKFSLVSYLIDVVKRVLNVSIRFASSFPSSFPLTITASNDWRLNLNAKKILLHQESGENCSDAYECMFACVSVFVRSFRHVIMLILLNFISWEIHSRFFACKERNGTMICAYRDHFQSLDLGREREANHMSLGQAQKNVCVLILVMGLADNW